MRNRTRNLVLGTVAMAFGICPVLRAADVPTTQPSVLTPATQPAGAVPTTQPANVSPTTQPATLREAAEARHKLLDSRWREFQYSQRNSTKARFADYPILTTFKPGSLVNFSIVGGSLKVEATDLSTPNSVRVAVEGSNAVWIVLRRNAMGNVAGRFALRPSFSVTRYDFDAKDDQPWQNRLTVTEQVTNFYSQSIYGTCNVTQTAAGVKVIASENTQMGRPAKLVYSGQAESFDQLRARQPEEFRFYVLPILSQFVDASFLLPGPADVYAAFPEIAADPKVTQEIEQLIPQLDADDPTDREAASEKLRQLGSPGVLAALRMNESGLSEEQKLRLRAFVFSTRRQPYFDSTGQRQDKAFLLDCLESEDPAVRTLAKAELENQLHQKLTFDPTLAGNTAGADAVRKQLLATPAPTTQPTTRPTTQPVPQV